MKWESISWLAPLALAVVLAACGGTSDETDPAPVTDRPAASSAAGDAPYDVQEDFGSYRLTMPVVRRWFEAQEQIYRAMGDNPALLDEVDSSHLDDVAALEAHFNGIPEVRAAVSRAGLRMREYVTILGTLYYILGVDAAIQDGADAPAVLANDPVGRANLEFAEQNRAELGRLQNRLDELESSYQ